MNLVNKKSNFTANDFPIYFLLEYFNMLTPWSARSFSWLYWLDFPGKLKFRANFGSYYVCSYHYASIGCSWRYEKKYQVIESGYCNSKPFLILKYVLYLSFHQFTEVGQSQFADLFFCEMMPTFHDFRIMRISTNFELR